MKLILLYYKELHYFNLPFSALLGISGLAVGLDFLSTFIVSSITVGFLLSVYFYEIRYADRYYFYFNRGISKLKLLTITYLIDVLLLIFYFVTKALV
ncbi:hypothetical protein [Reichenbachiella sp. MALMAid0571]|uniref:hypothetical protein n=1 Tax=Reichenbachiella sp. MALMAid0571 TaxID=3143939 RepID=UPI0032DF5803